MISQISDIIYLISVARTHRLQTPIAHYSIHHVNPDFFFGFDVSHENQIPMATPEKALIDFLYLSPAKSKQFYSLPELIFPDIFNKDQAFEFIDRIPSKRTRSLVKTKFTALMEAQT